MRERIHQLAGGQVDLPSPSLELLVSRIEETLAPQQNYRGDIRLTSGNGLALRGLIYSNDSRVVLLQNSFSGVSAYIPYEVQTDQMEPGTEVSGAFYLVYNGGETEVPFLFRIRQAGGEQESMPETLESFAKLAKENPEEAKEIFERRSFSQMPWMEDMSLRAVYDGLRRALKREHLTEEFLVASGAKERVKISVSTRTREYLVNLRGVKDRIAITRSGWGDLDLVISSDADWLLLDQMRLTEEDFEENCCEIPVRILYEELHAGKNLAGIRISSAFEEFVIPIQAVKAAEGASSAARKRQRKSEELEFLKTFLSVLAEHGDRSENLDYLQYCWEEMTGDEAPTPRQKLYRAAIGLWREERQVAAMILEDVERAIQDGRREDMDAYCAFMYLTMRVSESWEQKEQLIKILRHFEEMGQGSQFQTLLLLNLDEGSVSRPREVLEQLAGYFQQGSRSPFLYLEMTRIYNRHPDIIYQMDDMTCQVLWFAAKHGFLEEETAVYISSLAGQERRGHARFVRILKKLYETYERDEILGGICSLLIKGECRGEKEFSWFARGVEKDIRLTRLYDYYLYTVPENRQEAFPREIMLYFSYNSPRDPESQKHLYENLLRYYEDDAQMMASYQKQMRRFAVSCAQSGMIDESMAFLYDRLLELSDVDEKMARTLPDLLYAVKIRTAETSFTEAIVVYGEMEEEFSTPLHDGAAYLPMYSDRCRILFADKAGARYAMSGGETVRLMKHTEALEKRCRELAPRQLMLRLVESRRVLSAGTRTEPELRVLKRELEAREFHRQYKRELTSCVVQTAIRRRVPWEDEILQCVHYPGIPRDQRLVLTRILINLGRMTEAERQVRRIGYRELPLASLEKLVSQTIQNGLFTKDELLVDMCRYLFSEGREDENVLEYLCTHFNSSSKEMVPVLVRAARQHVQLSDMPERLLGQMLFTGFEEGIDDVFAIYQNQEQVDSELVHAYFVVKCDGYFFRGLPTEESVFRFVEQLLQKESEDAVPEVCVLALIRYYASLEHLQEEERVLGARLLSRLVRSGKVFAWMKQLDGKIRLPEEIRCREWIEYHGEPGDHLELWIRILPEMGEKSLRLLFPETTRGIYVKPVLLYAGDELQWEVRRYTGEILDQGSLQGLTSPASDGSRYAWINRMQHSVREGRRDRAVRWQDEVLEYAVRDTWVEELFSL